MSIVEGYMKFAVQETHLCSSLTFLRDPRIVDSSPDESFPQDKSQRPDLAPERKAHLVGSPHGSL
jgi:hypothetical protein